MAIDTETKDEGLASGRGPGWAYGAGYICGVGVAWRQGKEVRKIYVPVRHPDTDNFPKDQVAKWVRDITRKNRTVFFNGPYDIGWLNADMGVPVPPVIDDAGCMAVMIDENRRQEAGGPTAYSLDGCCAWRGIPMKDKALLRETAHVYGVNPNDAVKHVWRFPARYVGPYGEGDPYSTLLLAEDLRKELDAQSLWEAYRDEMDLIPMVHAMRERGISLNVDHAEELRDKYFARRDNVLDELARKIGVTRVTIEDIRSQQWLIRAFSQENVTYNTKTNDNEEEVASFEKDWMRRGYAGRDGEPHWLPRMIAEAKQCHEFSSKFVQGYLLDFAHRGRIHANINQFKSEDGGTRSHRFSYSDPPLQQMPSRPDPVEDWKLTEELATEVRGLFLPEPGELWFAPDYSQQEFRLMVHFASLLNCERADEAVAKYLADPKTDFHNLVVDLTGLPRRRAKDVNFAKAFGAGLYKFCQMTGMTMEDGKATMTQYDTEMPFIKQLSSKSEKAAQNRGWVRMISGARSHFDDYEAAWLSKEERDRGWSEGWPMAECSLAEARSRVAGECPRPWKAPEGSQHPWHGCRLKRAKTHKAMNRIIQGSAARQMKKAMIACWREKILPLIQMHDELGFSLSDPVVGERVAEIMREIVKLRVPMLVDAEWGPTWGKAKYTFNEARKMAA